MRVVLLSALFAALCFGASPTYATAEVCSARVSQAEPATEGWPGGNKKARKMSRRARKRTLGITKFTAFKVMKRRKAKRKKLQRAQKSGFHKADKRKAKRKKAGCNG